jgi:hypothetical protein
MFKKTILTILVVLSLLTYKFQSLIPLGFVLVVFYLYQVNKMLLINKKIIDENTADMNKVITTLLNNQKVLLSDIKLLRNEVDKHHGNKKIITKEVKKGIDRQQQ